MSAVERLAILITANGQGAIREFDKVGSAAERQIGGAENRVDRLGSKMTSAGAVMMGASAVMVSGLLSAGREAANLEQAVGGSEAVFKDHADGVKTWAKGAAESVGLSEEAALSLTTKLGGALKGLGYDQDKSATKSREMVQIAADLAATYGGTTADAVQALGSALRGEFDPAEQFNVFLKQSTVDAKAVEMGLASTTTEVDANARAQATLALITEQSADAQGQFARETDSTSGRLAIASAEFENLKAQIGAGFTPVMATAGQVAGAAAGGIKAADEATGGLASQVAGYGAVALGGAGATSFLIGQVISARENFKSAKAGVSDFASSLNISKGQVAGATVAMLALSIATAGYQQRMSDAAAEGRKAARELGRGLDPEDQLVAYKDKLRDINKELDTFKDSDAGKLFRSPTGGLFDFATAADKSRQSLESQRDTLETQIETLEDTKAATDSATGATTGHSKALDADTAAIQDRQNALLGMAGGELGLQSAQIASREQVVKYTEAMKDGTLSADQREQAGVDLLQSFLREAEAAGALAEEQAKAGGSTLDAAGKAAVQKQRLEELAGTLDPASPLRAQLQGYINKLGEVPSSVNTTLNIDDALAKTKLSDLQYQLTTLDGRVITATAQINARTSVKNYDGTWNLDNNPATGNGMAAGGPMQPWSVYTLHDTADPELAQVGDKTLLFTGAQGGRVTNLARSSTADGGVATQTPQVIFTGNIIVQDRNGDGGGAALIRYMKSNQGEIKRALGF